MRAAGLAQLDKQSATTAARKGTDARATLTPKLLLARSAPRLGRDLYSAVQTTNVRQMFRSKMIADRAASV